MSERGPAPYVHIEGMDLAGKTSATDLFIARRDEDWEVKRNSLSGDNPVRDLADAMLDSGEFSVETVGTVYAAALMADFDRFTRPDAPTIQESTIILRSIAYQAVNGTPRLTELFEGMMDRHPKFDASFMLNASHEARMARLAKQERHFSNHDLLIVRDPVKFFCNGITHGCSGKKAFSSRDNRHVNHAYGRSGRNHREAIAGKGSHIIEQTNRGGQIG
jgi:thymidylate kinase